MKKILFLNTVYNGGGAAKVARQIFEFLDKSNEHDVYFAHGRGQRNSNNKIFKFGNKIEFFLHVFLVRFLGIEGFGSYFSTRKLIRYIKKNNFDIIHIHNIHGYYLNFFTLIKFLGKNNIKIFWTLHDEWCLTWLPAYSFGCDHCKTLIGECSNFNIYPKTYNIFFAKMLFGKKKRIFSQKWNPTIVCPADWIKKEVEKSYLSDKKIITVYNGIDINLFENKNNQKELRDKYSLPNDKFIILFSAVNIKDKRKGGEFLLEVIKNINNDKVLFLAVGGGKLEDINNNIIFKKYINNEVEMRDIYSLSDLYIFPSLAETMPLSILEAMSCQLPAIAFDIPPVIEIFENSPISSSVICSKETLIGSISQIIYNKELLSSIGLEERRIVENNFSLNKTFENYINLYNN